MQTDANSSPISSNLTCPLCGGLFAYEQPTAPESTSELIACPHCRQEIEIQAPDTDGRQDLELPPIIPQPVPEPIWFGSESAIVRVIAAAGTQCEITEVLLYDEQHLQNLEGLKQKANQLFGGAQSQYGFIGDIGWVVGMTTLQNWMLRAESDNMAKEGLKILEDIRALETQLRKHKKFFLIGQVQNIEHPAPQLWRAEETVTKRGYIHNGDDFLTVKDSAGATFCMRWSAIAHYEHRASQA